MGDVVLVADTDKHRHHWELGVVTELILGADKFCRAAIVRTPRGRTSRSIVKLYPLEVHVDSTDSPIEGLSERSIRKSPRPARKAAFTARDAIMAQLIDGQQD